MTIVVCPLSRVGEMVIRYAPERVISLLGPEYAFPDLDAAHAGRHLQLRVHDIATAGKHALPTVEDARELIAFIEQWRQERPLLVHCHAGVGRSTAAAYIAACTMNPSIDERLLARALRRASPLARPSESLIDVADRVLNRNGRMLRAIEETGRKLPLIDVAENVPFELRSKFD